MHWILRIGIEIAAGMGYLREIVAVRGVIGGRGAHHPRNRVVLFMRKLVPFPSGLVNLFNPGDLTSSFRYSEDPFFGFVRRLLCVAFVQILVSWICHCFPRSRDRKESFDSSPFVSMCQLVPNQDKRINMCNSAR